MTVDDVEDGMTEEREERRHVLGQPCWCGADVQVTTGGQAVAVLGTTPTSHLFALASDSAAREHGRVRRAAADAERAAAVAHLRAKAAAYASDPALVSGKGALELAAEDLERGVHRG